MLMSNSLMIGLSRKVCLVQMNTNLKKNDYVYVKLIVLLNKYHRILGYFKILIAYDELLSKLIIFIFDSDSGMRSKVRSFALGSLYHIFIFLFLFLNYIQLIPYSMSFFD